MIDPSSLNRRRASRIRAVMEERNVSVEAIAKACSVEVNTVQKWLSGSNRIQPVNLEIILQLLDVSQEQLDTPILDLLNGQKSTPMDGYAHVIHSCGFDHHIRMTKDQCRSLLREAVDLSCSPDTDEEHG